jgi:hypothetical protein
MLKKFAKLCTPAKIYFAIAVIAALVELFNGFGILAIVLKLVFALIWTFVLGWLCDKGLHSLSWFLVLLPYIVMLLAMLRIMRLSSEQRGYLNAVKLQGPFGKENFQSNEAMTNTNKKNKKSNKK